MLLCIASLSLEVKLRYHRRLSGTKSTPPWHVQRDAGTPSETVETLFSYLVVAYSDAIQHMIALLYARLALLRVPTVLDSFETV